MRGAPWTGCQSAERHKIIMRGNFENINMVDNLWPSEKSEMSEKVD